MNYDQEWANNLLVRLPPENFMSRIRYLRASSNPTLGLAPAREFVQEFNRLLLAGRLAMKVDINEPVVERASRYTNSFPMLNLTDQLSSLPFGEAKSAIEMVWSAGPNYRSFPITVFPKATPRRRRPQH